MYSVHIKSSKIQIHLEQLSCNTRDESLTPKSTSQHAPTQDNVPNVYQVSQYHATLSFAQRHLSGYHLMNDTKTSTANVPYITIRDIRAYTCVWVISDAMQNDSTNWIPPKDIPILSINQSYVSELVIMIRKFNSTRMPQNNQIPTT